MSYDHNEALGSRIASQLGGMRAQPGSEISDRVWHADGGLARAMPEDIAARQRAPAAPPPPPPEPRTVEMIAPDGSRANCNRWDVPTRLAAGWRLVEEEERDR